MTGAPVRVVGALGTAQTLAWASSYYLPAMLAAPMAADLGVATPTVFAAFSGAMVVSALVGPWAGLAIDRHGGRVVLAGTSLVFALGLGMLGFAQGLWTMVIAWLVIGAAMGAGLYEAAFSSLVRLYGQHARGAITGITLLAGFASTVGWPLSAWMETRFGWRNACLGWAGIHLLIGLPLNAWLPTLPSPAQPERTAAADPAQAIASASPPPVAAAGGSDTRPPCSPSCSPQPGSSAPRWPRICRGCWRLPAPRSPPRSPWAPSSVPRRWPAACWSSGSCGASTRCCRRAWPRWHTPPA